MTYAVSDIHGCYSAYLDILSQIKFSDDDTMYIIGDAIDRGKDGLNILFDVLNTTNIHLLMGNHEYIMAILLSNASNDDISPENLKAGFALWFDDGGMPTFQRFLALSNAEKQKITRLLAHLPLYAEITVCGRDYILVHSGFGNFSPDRELKSYSADELLFHRNDLQTPYFPNKTVIAGHTPTFAYGPEFTGKMLKKNGIINIDCGCFYDKSGMLGCLRLDDMAEFYAGTANV